MNTESDSSKPSHPDSKLNDKTVGIAITSQSYQLPARIQKEIAQALDGNNKANLSKKI